MKTHSVVVVTSNPDNAIALSGALESETIHIQHFTSAVSAMKHLRKCVEIDMVIMDLHLPDIDGWRFCRLLRSPEFKNTNQTPIIITSSIFRDADLEGIARNIGANAHIAMPFENKKINELVLRILNAHPALPLPVALIIEDDLNVAKFLISGLTGHGYEAKHAATGKDALSLCRAQQPSLIIADHILPDTESIHILPELKTVTKDKDVVLVAITAVSDPDLAIQYTYAGADIYLRKPFSMPYLIDLVNNAQREKALLHVEELLDLRTKSLYTMGLYFRDLYENAPVGYHTLDENGLILSMNSTELKWLGYSTEEVVGRRTIFDIQTSRSNISGRKMFKELKTTGGLKDAELEFVRKDGSIMTVLIQSSAICDSNGKFVSCRTIVRDISEQKSLEEQLRQAQKMESLGIMSAGIAHNFNNLLTPILVNSTELMDEFQNRPEIYCALEDIAEAARRGANLVEQLMGLGRKQETIFEKTDLRKIVLDNINILNKTIDKSIEIHTDFSEEIVSITGNLTTIQQCILNICFNARDAMPNGGKMTISLNVSEITDETLSISAFAHIGKYVVLSVMDTGIGMSKEVQNKIFDPFFTTKGMAKGTGLGLSTAYGIMKDHGGFIHVYSEENEGSIFRLYFPFQPDLQNNTSAKSGTLKPAGNHFTKPIPTANEKLRAYYGTENILIIDDEPDVLRSADRILKHSGYSTLQAQDGLSALDIVRSRLAPPDDNQKNTSHSIQGIDIILLDIVMPGMTGEKVFQHLRVMMPYIPIIITSGYGNSERARKFVEKGAKIVISKPFEREKLLMVIRETLDELK